jgi:hypothetical protein
MIMCSQFIRRKSDGLSKCGNINRDSRSGVWKNRFIEHDITRDVNMPRGFIETLIPFMHTTVSEEDTLLTPKHKFMSIILTKTRSARTAKRVEILIVWMDTEEPNGEPLPQYEVVGVEANRDAGRCGEADGGGGVGDGEDRPQWRSERGGRGGRYRGGAGDLRGGSGGALGFRL